MCLHVGRGVGGEVSPRLKPPPAILFSPVSGDSVQNQVKKCQSTRQPEMEARSASQTVTTQLLLLLPPPVACYCLHLYCATAPTCIVLQPPPVLCYYPHLRSYKLQVLLIAV